MINGERFDLYSGDKKMGEVLTGPMAFATLAHKVTKVVWRGRVILNTERDGIPQTVSEWAAIVAPRMNAIRAELRGNIEVVTA